MDKTPELTEAEMVEILKEIARDGSNAAARIAAIKQLREMGHGSGEKLAVRTVIDTIRFNIGQLDLRLYEEIGLDERAPPPFTRRVAAWPSSVWTGSCGRPRYDFSSTAANRSTSSSKMTAISLA
jgi:hypothetical protein